MAIRAIIEHPQKGFKRFPWSQFERVLGGLRSVPDFSGKQIRYSLAYVDVAKRTPFLLRRLEFGVLKFGADGYRDQKDWDERMKLEIATIGYDVNHSAWSEMQNAIAVGRRAELYKWNPTTDERKIITALAMAR